MSGLIPLLKLIIDSGAFSPSAPPEITPPSSKAGIRPNCGFGKKAILVNDAWQCVPDFK
jgi:hypothetical protein